jgi:hypothetical protein
MADKDLPSEVHRLIAEVISSMDHVEVLRRLQARPEEPMTLDAIAADTHLDRGLLVRVLHDLQSVHLISESDGVYRYVANTRDADGVRQLIEMYNTRPVTLVRAVYARLSPVKTFADAFRIRRED